MVRSNSGCTSGHAWNQQFLCELFVWIGHEAGIVFKQVWFDITSPASSSSVFGHSTTLLLECLCCQWLSCIVRASWWIGWTIVKKQRECREGIKEVVTMVLKIYIWSGQDEILLAAHLDEKWDALQTSSSGDPHYSWKPRLGATYNPTFSENLSIN